MTRRVISIVLRDPLSWSKMGHVLSQEDMILKITNEFIIIQWNSCNDRTSGRRFIVRIFIVLLGPRATLSSNFITEFAPTSDTLYSQVDLVMRNHSLHTSYLIRYFQVSRILRLRIGSSILLDNIVLYRQYFWIFLHFKFEFLDWIYIYIYIFFFFTLHERQSIMFDTHDTIDISDRMSIYALNYTICETR